jgi:hypothetical protein
MNKLNHHCDDDGYNKALTFFTGLQFQETDKK